MGTTERARYTALAAGLALYFVVCIGAVTFFALVVGPRFEEVFKSMHAELPLMTRCLLATFAFIRHYLLFILGGIFGLFLNVGLMMLSRPTFTVHSPFLAMKSLSRRSLFVTIPVGTDGEIVEEYDDLDRPGFVLIRVGGRHAFHLRA